MKTISVKSLHGAYPIFIGRALLEKAGCFLKARSFKGKVLIVTQEPIARHYLKLVLKSFHTQKIPAKVHLIPDGEVSKSEEELFHLYQALGQYNFERGDMIFALGGGVVGDLAGFAAATYLRGIAYVNAGTTLLAQVDSSMGGKTAIDLPQGKNLVGAFYPPKMVISDVSALKTLSPRELQASLAEVVKYGVIRDERLFDYLEKRKDFILKRNLSDLQHVVVACAKIKAGVVTRDERETKGERMILNFGHTFAHAIEKGLHFRKLVHGEAVSIGMSCAARLAVRLKLFSQKEEKRLQCLLEQLHLPVSMDGLDLEINDLFKAMSRDKKKSGGTLRFVLPVKIGKVVIRDDVSNHCLRSILWELGGR